MSFSRASVSRLQDAVYACYGVQFTALASCRCMFIAALVADNAWEVKATAPPAKGRCLGRILLVYRRILYPFSLSLSLRKISRLEDLVVLLAHYGERGGTRSLNLSPLSLSLLSLFSVFPFCKPH